MLYATWVVHQWGLADNQVAKAGRKELLGTVWRGRQILGSPGLSATVKQHTHELSGPVWFHLVMWFFEERKAKQIAVRAGLPAQGKCGQGWILHEGIRVLSSDP